jgi:hypothetical protein
VILRPRIQTEGVASDRRERFERFVERKTREAAAARIETLSTIVDRRDDGRLRGIGNGWYGGAIVFEHARIRGA